jgi:hypothetical protein
VTTTAQVLRGQARQAEADRQRPRSPMPKGLTALQREQWGAWGWCDVCRRAKRKWFHTECEGEPGLTGDEGDQAMSLGKRRSRAAAFDPIIKMDCRQGTITRCDRQQGEDGSWQTVPVLIATEDFEAVADLAHLQVGYLCFSPPDFKLVNVGEDYGDPPSDNHREGFKLRLLLRNGAGEGVHDLASTAAAMWQSMDELHSEYEDGKAKHKNKLPVIGIAEWARVTTRQGTGYRPVFKITGWTAVPKELAR